jgi:hypothetical protein
MIVVRGWLSRCESRFRVDGTFAVAVSQLAELNLVSQYNASRDLKAILGKDFQLVKSSSELNPKKFNIIVDKQVSIK